jgi:hypothetical protein
MATKEVGNSRVYKRFQPRYDKVCVGSECIAIKACIDIPRALAALGIDEPELAELVVMAICEVVGDER